MAVLRLNPSRWVVRRRKAGHQTVIVFLCDRIELVIVAPGTGHGQPEQIAGQVFDGVEQNFSAVPAGDCVLRNCSCRRLMFAAARWP